MACKKPETLRKMVTESRSLSPPLISKDKSNVSEIDILYNRIDQQVELISVLKQRLDEMTRRWERSEAEHEQQELERSKIQQSNNQLTDRYSNLEVRWQQLAENHNEMILVKDDYKEKCRILKDRLKKFESGESAAVASEQRKCNEYQKKITELKCAQKKQLSYEIELHEKIKGLESTVSCLHEEEKQLSQQQDRDRNLHFMSVSQLELKLENNTHTIQLNKNQNEELTTQIADLTQQIINRGKLVQEKEHQIKKVETEKEKLAEKNKKISSELSALKESVNSNRIVRELREDLLEERDSHNKLEKELAMFKVAAKEALLQEQKVNEELRHVSSVRQG